MHHVLKVFETHGVHPKSKHELAAFFEKLFYSIEYSKANTLSIINSLPHATWLKDKDGLFIHVNNHYLQNANLELDKVIGKSVFDIFPANLANKFNETDQEVLKTGKTVYKEYNRADRFYESYKSPVFNHEGEIIGTTGMEIDVTENKRLYQFLSEERNFLNSLMDYFPYTIYFKDKHCRFTKINHAQCQLLGVKNFEDVIGKTDADFFDQDHAQKSYEDELKIMQTGIPMVGRIEHLRNAKGDYIWVSATKVALKDEEGNIQGIVGISIDVTHQIETETALKMAKSKAEEADKLKSAFLANMSHEIRTPMNGIIGFSDLLKRRDISGAEREKYISHIEESSKALLKLIEDIIDISKMEAKQLTLYPMPFNINEILDDLFGEIKNELKLRSKSHLNLLVEKPQESENLVIIADKSRLKQVLLKTLLNAVKFTEEGEISYGYSTTDDQLIFFVRDTGVGIPVEKMNIIFERFGQILEHRKMDHPGTGMGLSIAYQLVKLMNGNMWVESTEEKGSTFFISLPLIEAKEQTISKGFRKHIEENFNWQHKRILIAEDEELNFIYLNELLSVNQPHIERAANGAEALKKCKDNLPDLILMDVKMPIMDGYIATREIKKLFPNVPIIAQTAYALQDEKQRSIEAGCDDYISKPINKDKLFSMINTYLSRQKQETKKQ